MDALKLLQLRQAQTRLEYAQKQTASTQAAATGHRYLGYDAERGKAILSNGIEEISGDRITNGAIKPNQPVRVTQAGNRVVVDAMPRPKPKPPQAEPTERGKIKVLLSKFVDGEQLFYVAGDRSTPKLVTRLPKGAIATRAQIDNLGRGDRWFVSILYTLDGQRFGRTLENSTQTEFIFSGSPVLLGYGFWNDGRGNSYSIYDRGEVIFSASVTDTDLVFAYDRWLAPGLIKPILQTRLDNVIGNPLVIQSDYQPIYLNRGEAIYTYQTSGITPEPFYWKDQGEFAEALEVQAERPIDFINRNPLELQAYGETFGYWAQDLYESDLQTFNFVQGNLYWARIFRSTNGTEVLADGTTKIGFNPYRSTSIRVLQWDFQASLLFENRHRFFPLPNNPVIDGIATYSAWGYSFHPN